MKSESEKEQSESESDKQDGESLKKPKAQNDANQAREEKMIKGRNSKAEKSQVKFLSSYSGLGS